MDKTDLDRLVRMIDMIRTDIVDLYAHYGLDRNDAADGRLLCWIWNTPPQISPHWRKRPAVLIIPGGGYHHVSPREAEPVAMRFLARGYAAFVLEYSVAPSAFPVSLREACLAMRYIREHADTLEVNQNMVSAIGFSAGGHLCGMLGTLYDAPEVSNLGSPSLLRPDALGLCYPVAISWGHTHEGSFLHLTHNEPILRKRLSLDNLVRPDMPPVYLWHTRSDTDVPVRNSLVLAQALDEAGVSFAMHIFRDGPHGMSVSDPQSYPAHTVPVRSKDVPDWPENMMQFFTEIGFAITDGEEP